MEQIVSILFLIWAAKALIFNLFEGGGGNPTRKEIDALRTRRAAIWRLTKKKW